MLSNRSILWNDATLDQDRALVAYLVENIVAGEKVAGHYDKCIHKIMDTIQAGEWQAAYPQRTYIFSVYYGISIKSVVEIGFALHAQALELLYFNIASTSATLVCNTSLSFDQKLRIVFREIYGWSMPHQTANVMRILRNDVMHTGTIAGVIGAYSNQDDPLTLTTFFEDYEFNKNQQHTDVQNRIHLAASFNAIVENMVVRTLGLDQNDLVYNLTPPWLQEIFGYDHEHRPDWLRE